MTGCPAFIASGGMASIPAALSLESPLMAFSSSAIVGLASSSTNTDRAGMLLMAFSETVF